jgi:hypothetical protein
MGVLTRVFVIFEPVGSVFRAVGLHVVFHVVAVLPLVSATSDSIVIPLDRYLFPHLFLTLYHTLYTALPFETRSAPFQRSWSPCCVGARTQAPHARIPCVPRI